MPNEMLELMFTVDEVFSKIPMYQDNLYRNSKEEQQEESKRRISKYQSHTNALR